jgi:hypothetical protein
MGKVLVSHLFLALLTLLGTARGQSGSVTPSPAAYSAAGGTISFAVTLTFSGELTALAFEVGTLPAGWTYVAAAGVNPPPIQPAVGDVGDLSFAFTAPLPASPVNFSFAVAYPPGLTGPQALAGMALILRATGTVPQTIAIPNLVLSAGVVPPTAPRITTQPRSLTVAEGATATFGVVATGTAPLAYSWRKDGVPLVGASTPGLILPAVTPGAAGTYTVVVSNAGGSVLSEPAQLAVTAAPPAFAITRPPAGAALTAGGSVVLTVGVTGTGPFAYQWYKDGVALPGATGPELALRQVGPADAGDYEVEVMAGGVRRRSAAARVTVTAPVQAPRLVRQPRPAVAVAGGRAAFDLEVTAYPSPTYQWRRNGAAIAGATGPALVLAAAQTGDAGLYEATVRNAAGTVTSAAVPLTVVAAPVAPVFWRQPVPVTAVAGRRVVLTAEAGGAPAPTYQWRRDGADLPGATAGELVLAALAPEHEGRYSVVAANTAGRVESVAVPVRALRRDCAGFYRGELGAGGRWALQVRADHSGVFLGFDAATGRVFRQDAVNIGVEGRFRLTAPVRVRTAAGETTGADLVWEGEISATGVLTGGAVAGGLPALAATREVADGEHAAVGRNLCSPRAHDQAGTATVLVGPAGQFLAVFEAGGPPDAAEGSLDSFGKASATSALSRQSVALDLDAAARSLVVARIDAAGTTAYRGWADDAPGRSEQRLANLSTRTTAGVGGEVAIVGFVVEGVEAKTVLIRAVGPTLADFGVGGALRAPGLAVMQGAVQFATNAGWGTAPDPAALAAAATRAGAFALAEGNADSALLLNLVPGAYSAVVSATDGRPGVGLVEVYDLSGGAAGQRLSNLSTRAVASTGDTALIVGIVVDGAAPKRLLVRAVGPTLEQFGVTGVLARPQLVLLRGSAQIALNAGWSAHPDTDEIRRVASRVGAFALPAGSRDAALILSLEPGAYTAQVSGEGDTTGVALVEVYEVP